jgi:chromosome segregation ATPase
MVKYIKRPRGGRRLAEISNNDLFLAINELAKSVNEMKETVDSTEKRITNMETRLTSIEDRVTNIETEMKEMRIELKQDIRKVDKKVGVLSAELLEAKTDITLLQQQI